ncbi:MAG: hypothetical protein HUJ69_03405 [Lachnospiraceae bacterium]|nr:hypothetical protein [Lachnospiraceae bacterium]
MRSIKWKMAVLYVLLVVIVMTGQGALILYNLRANAYGEVYQKSVYSADRIIDMLSVKDIREQEGPESVFGEVLTALLIETGSTAVSGRSETSVYLFSEDGRLLYSRREEAAPTSRTLITVLAGERVEELYVHKLTENGLSVGDYALSFELPQNHKQYILLVRQSMEAVRERLQSYTIIIFLVTLLGMIVAGFLGYLLAVSISDPILKLTEKTQELSAGARSEQEEKAVPGEEEPGEKVTEFGDELDILEVNFDDMARELTTSIRELKAMEQMQKEFVANVSHELRTPVTTIKSYSETLLDSDLQDSELIRQFLTIIAHESDRMAALIADLLELSRMDAHQVSVQAKPTEVGNLLRQDMMDMFREAEQKHQKIIWDEVVPIDEDESGEFPWPSGEFWILAGGRRIEQVIRNLLTNAIKYSPEHTVIRGGIALSEGAVCLWIRDEGIGISPEDQQRIFNRFYRVDKARSRSMGGTGLGLAIAKQTTELYGGRIWVESTPGEGSTFYLLFPEAPEVDRDVE